jgi:ubiquinone/menaquinone biosynthesis C-methylase UbiE
MDPSTGPIRLLWHVGRVTSPHVSYERVAGEYAQHRTPTEATLSIWGGAVTRFVQDVSVAVDLAAGTGCFSAALRAWGAERVVAVEPSRAMQAEMAPTSGVIQVTGRAEAVPVRSHAAGLIWISTAFHHFADPQVSVKECRRVLLDGGHVAVRGFVPGHTDLAWLELFPGSHKARARFPDLRSMNALFATAGLTLVHTQLVEEGTQTYGERADFSERMRHADSILTAMTDAEVDSGIANLRARRDEIEHFALSLLVYQAQ